MKQETDLCCSFSCSQYRKLRMWLCFHLQLLSLLAFLGSCRSECNTLENWGCKVISLAYWHFWSSTNSNTHPYAKLFICLSTDSITWGKNNETNNRHSLFNHLWTLKHNHLPLRHAADLGVLFTWFYHCWSKPGKSGIGLAYFPTVAISDAILVYSSDFGSELVMKVFDTVTWVT